MRTRRLLPLLLLAACDKGAIVLDDTGDSSVVVDPNDPCPVLVVDVTSLSWAGGGVGNPESRSVTVTNDCPGEVSLTLSAAIDGDSSFTLVNNALVLSPGQAGTVDVIFNAPDEALHEATLTLSGNEEQSAVVALSGTASADYDQDGYDSFAAGGTDCDDLDPGVNPGAPESWYDGVDQNCDGLSDYDQDTDGADSVDYGGADCDDTDATVGPDAEEVWYDGVDQDCDGGDDYDQDGDGDQAPEGGGGDCDDTNAAVNSTQPELDDALDNNCDGIADEHLLTGGELLITEVMVNPRAADDSVGEYVELLNTSGRTLNLVGWTLSASGSAVSLDQDLFIDPDEYVLLAASDDTSSNGGAAADWGWAAAGTLSLNNTSDTLAVSAGAVAVTSLTWGTGWPLTAGSAMNLDDSFLSATYGGSADYWCAASSSFGSGDLGTPGGLNDNCTSVDHDGDGYSVDEGDCADDNADVSPGEVEALDGVDNDCDGDTDNLGVGDVLGGYLTGADNDSYLGAGVALGLGDLTGDGVVDLVTGGLYRGSNSEGTLYVVSGSDYTSWAGSVASYADYTLSGDVREYVGFSSHLAGDVNGDGVADLAWSGSDAYYGYYYGSHAGGVVFGKGLSTGDAGDVSAITFEEAETYPSTSYDGPDFHPQIANHLDLDGDGFSDVVYGDPAWGGSDYNGAVYAFSGADLGTSGDYNLADDADVILDGGDDDNLGAWVGGADVDGDGYDDLWASAPGDGTARSGGGAIYLWEGRASLSADSTMSSAAAITLQGDSRDEYLGFRGGVFLGDPDGDGDQDLAVGSLFEESVYLFLDASSLSGAVLTSAADVTVSSSSAPDYFGMALAWGDYDGDGVDDLAVGAPDAWGYSSSDASTTGRVWLFGGATLTSGVSALDTSDAMGSVQGEGSSHLFGATVLSADFNSDGKDDLAVTASGYSSTYGRVYVIDW